MKILFSPSEAKSQNSPLEGNLKDSLSFKELYTKREVVLKKYQDFLDTASLEQIAELVGIKDKTKVQKYKELDIFSSDLQLAVLRYSGVGYDYLDFLSLEDEAKDVFLSSTIIFSNLFGPIKAGDKIPYYKLKQGKNIADFVPSKFYAECFHEALDEFLEDDLVVDLRAKFYESFYKPKKRICVKFLKDGKVVSHYAKAYRGLLARALAIHNPKNEDEFKAIAVPDLYIKEILIKGKTTTYIYDILQ